MTSGEQQRQELLQKLLLASRLRYIIAIAKNLKAQQELVEQFVLETPTGPERDKLTEVNIFILEAIVALGSIAERKS